MSNQTKQYGRFGRLYHGLTTINFVGRKKIWFTFSAIIIVLGLGSLSVRGFNLGIDFRGGSSFEVLAPNTSVAAMTTAVTNAGLVNPTVTKLGKDTFQVTADLNGMSTAKQGQITNSVIAAMAKVAGVGDTQVSMSTIGPSWGSGVTNKALQALIVFFIAVGIYISFRFEFKMAVAAFAAMLHDLLVVVGVYSILNFQITPDTVIAVLTILGYSLYDTVVVFDRVRDNSSGILNTGDVTYGDMVNLSMNQTLARSINTSLVAILPVLSVLVVGAYILGATTLKTYGLALFIGLVSGAYSSIFIASPLLAVMKEREPRFRDLKAKVALREKRVLTAASTARAQIGDETQVSGTPLTASAQRGVIAARARKQKRR